MLIPGLSLAILMTAMATVTKIEPKMKYVNIVILVLALAFLTVTMAGFMANSIQFGVDQLLDSPWEDQRVFIAWFVWVFEFAKAAYTLINCLIVVNYGIDTELQDEMLSAILLAFIMILLFFYLFLCT